MSNGIDSPKEFKEKLVSLNPDRYEPKPTYILLANYADYVLSVARTSNYDLKTFDNWCLTEI